MKRLLLYPKGQSWGVEIKDPGMTEKGARYMAREQARSEDRPVRWGLFQGENLLAKGIETARRVGRTAG